jgi:seryl-tRNA synthetase
MSRIPGVHYLRTSLNISRDSTAEVLRQKHKAASDAYAALLAQKESLQKVADDVNREFKEISKTKGGSPKKEKLVKIEALVRDLENEFAKLDPKLAEAKKELERSWKNYLAHQEQIARSEKQESFIQERYRKLGFNPNGTRKGGSRRSRSYGRRTRRRHPY